MIQLDLSALIITRICSKNGNFPNFSISVWKTLSAQKSATQCKIDQVNQKSGWYWQKFGQTGYKSNSCRKSLIWDFGVFWGFWIFLWFGNEDKKCSNMSQWPSLLGFVWRKKNIFIENCFIFFRSRILFRKMLTRPLLKF